MTNNEAIEVLKSEWKINSELFGKQFDEALELAIKALEERPTGEWKCFIGSAHYGVDEDNEPIWRIRKIYHCPFCNRRTVIKENYCPNCGADMRGCKVRRI